MKKVYWAITLILCAIPAFAQTQSNPLFDRLQNAILNRDEKAFLALVVDDPAVQKSHTGFIRSVLSFPFQKGVIRLAEQQNEKMILHLFFQARDEARFESWVVKTKQVENELRIQDCSTINSITGLFRLTMSDRPFAVHNLKFTHLDSVIYFKQGYIYPIEAGTELAGILFIGDASFEFTPPDRTEKQQVTLFVKKPRIDTTVTSLFLRSSSEMLDELLKPLADSRTEANPQLLARVQSESKDFDRLVYSVRIPFSEELWFAQMEEGELYCEMKTSLGTLLYQHSPTEPDDVLVARKDKDQVISLYNSRGFRFQMPPENDLSVLSYKMKIRFDPAATHLTSETEIRLKSPKDTTNIVFRLNPDLRVSQIQSNQGYLIYFQEKKTNNLHVVLNEALHKNDEITLEFFYQGKIAPEKRSPETMDIQGTPDNDFYIPPSYLYSNQSIWYPQLTSNPYSGVKASVTVPQGYAAVVNGIRTDVESKDGETTFSYNCEIPAKYFSLFVGRLDSRLRVDGIVPIDVYYLSLDKKAAEDFGKSADKILRFYSEYFGPYPYKNLAVVLRPIQQPGGHAPATVAIVNRVFKFFQKKFAKDPLYVPEYPDFLLAHEIAHQWWGQTVGWRTYRDQWLSEGFAQFAAWEYMRSEHGEQAWKKLAENFRNWIADKSYAGPIILGARLGHITEDPQAFSALVYNKGAYTLNMLKYWMGEKQFSACLTEFFKVYKYQRVGIEDFVALAQKFTDQDLTPFFQQWLYGWELPDVRWTIHKEGSGTNIRFEQLQKDPYMLKIPIEVKSKKGELFRFVANVNQATQEVPVNAPFLPTSVQVDPTLETLMHAPQ
jgi:hypothetical protein